MHGLLSWWCTPPGLQDNEQSQESMVWSLSSDFSGHKARSTKSHRGSWNTFVAHSASVFHLPQKKILSMQTVFTLQRSKCRIVERSKIRRSRAVLQCRNIYIVSVSRTRVSRATMQSQWLADLERQASNLISASSCCTGRVCIWVFQPTSNYIYIYNYIYIAFVEKVYGHQETVQRTRGAE